MEKQWFTYGDSVNKNNKPEKCWCCWRWWVVRKIIATIEMCAQPRRDQEIQWAVHSVQFLYASWFVSRRQEKLSMSHKRNRCRIRLEITIINEILLNGFLFSYSSLLIFFLHRFIPLPQIIMIINSNLIRSMNFKWENIASLWASISPLLFFFFFELSFYCSSSLFLSLFFFCVCIVDFQAGKLLFLLFSARHSKDKSWFILVCVWLNGSFDEITNHL